MPRIIPPKSQGRRIPKRLVVRSLRAPKIFCATRAMNAPTPSTSDNVAAFPCRVDLVHLQGQSHLCGRQQRKPGAKECKYQGGLEADTH